MRDFQNWSYLKPFAEKIGSGITPRGGETVYRENGIPFIRSQNVRSGQLVLDEVVFIDERQHLSMSNSWVRPLDVLLNITGASIGRSCVVPENIGAANVNQHVCIIRLKGELDPYYVSCFLNSPYGQRQVWSFQSGGSREGLNYAQIGAFRLPVPSLAEQVRIAAIIRTWDEAITQMTQLLAAVAKRRDYLRDNMLNPSRWPFCAVGSFLRRVSRPVPTPKTSYKALGIRSHGKGTFQRLIERPAEIGMDTVYVVGANDLIVNITFAWEGAIALSKPEDADCLVSHRFPTFEIDEGKVNRQFVGYAVRTRRFIHQLGIASPGGAGRNRVLNIAQFLKLEIPLPPRAEQDRIADILNTADQEIALVDSKIEAFEKQKLGIMQKLLAGEYHVAHDGESDVEPSRVVEEAIR